MISLSWHCFKFHRRTVRTKKHSARHAQGQGRRSHFPRGSEDTSSARGHGFSSKAEGRKLCAQCGAGRGGGGVHQAIVKSVWKQVKDGFLNTSGMGARYSTVRYHLLLIGGYVQSLRTSVFMPYACSIKCGGEEQIRSGTRRCSSPPPPPSLKLILGP